ncbi:hypothetical protein HDV04_005264 [Boothiomyces sp. JEL0838]|nr:hypothetical protein HDV04_005264 [Boothiomyces sp. JEL0838]
MQSINFLNFHIFGLFTVFRFAPKFNNSYVVAINIVASIVINSLYIPYKLIGNKSLYISYLAVLGTWILVTLITGTMIGFYIPVVISRAQKKYKGTLHGLINTKYALLGLGLLDWIGVFIYFYKAMQITSKIRDDKKKSQMNSKRRKSATNEEIVQEEIRSVEEVGSMAE